MQFEYPVVKKNETRAIPITIQSQDLFMLQQAKMRVQNEQLDKQSALSNRESRYNTKLFDDIDQEKINKNVDVACNRAKYVPPKCANKSAMPDNNIALYYLRGDTSLNNQTVIGNVLPERLKAMRDSKITTPNAWMKDYSYINQSYKNTGIPEIYNQGADLKAFPTDKEAFDNEFKERQKLGPMKQEETKLSDYGYGLDMEGGNYNGYLSMLMPSETNVPQSNLYNDYEPNYLQPNAAMFPDERMQRNLQTAERQAASDNAKVIMAANLQKSPYIQERLERQKEMETMMNHRGQMKLPMLKTQDYVDMLDEQNNGITHDRDYTLDKSMTDMGSKYNDRNSGGQKFSNKATGAINVIAQENVLENTRLTPMDLEQEYQKSLYQYDIDKELRMPKDIEYIPANIVDVEKSIDDREYIAQVARQKLGTMDDLNNTRQKVYQYKDSEREKQKVAKTVDKREQYRQDLRQEHFEDNSKKTIYINDKQRFYNKGLDDITKPQRNQIGTSSYPILNILRGHGYIKREFFDKKGHILVQRKGEVSNVYTSPNSDTTAPVLLSLDVNKKPIRTFVTKNKESIYIIQKRDPTYLDITTGNYYKDDYVALKIPLEQLSDSLKRNIEAAYIKQNKGFGPARARNPSKIVSLEYEDLVTMAEIIHNNAAKTKRIKTDSMKRYLENNEFDKHILNGFDDKVFTTPFVVEQMLMDERYKEDRVHTEERSKRIDKETFERDVHSNNLPQNDMQYSGEIRENYLGTMGSNPNNPSQLYNGRNKQLSSHYYNFEEF